MSNHILIAGPAWIGDMVMAQALFKLLKQRSPHCHIDVLAPTRTIALVSRMPEIQSVIEAPFLHLKFEFRKHYELAQRLRAQHYEQVIVLPGSFKSAVSPWLAGIKKRTGWLGECRYFALNDIRYLDKKQYPLMVDRYVALGLPSNEPLTKPYSYPELHISIDSLQVLHRQHPSLWSGRPILAMCIGAEFGQAKRWPAEYYAQVADEKINAGWDVWLVGSSNESLIAEKIMQLTHHRCDDLTGRFGLAEMIDLLSLVSGVITNDTGLMHIAAALNKPLVVLYGSTSPQFTPPLSNNAIILKLDMDCQPCFKRTCPLEHYRCLVDLKPERVLEAMSAWGL